MRVIFLDIDGVLNSVRSCLGLGGYGHLPWPHDADAQASDDVYRKRCLLDPVAVGLLNRILQETEAKVVVSSTWRMGTEPEDLERFFAVHELPSVVIGRTPSLMNANRGTEIKSWLHGYPEVTDYVILDDDSDMLASQRSHFFQVDADVGLGFREYDLFRARWGTPAKEA